MPYETSTVRLWRSLPRSDRDAAAAAFWEHPPREIAALAAQDIVKVLRVRPQAFHKVSLRQRVSTLAALAQPADAVAEALLVALHLETRRQLLIDFLDAIGVEHEEGLLAEDAEFPPLDEAKARAALATLRARHPVEQIRLYWNALWLQDPGHWAALAAVQDEI